MAVGLVGGRPSEVKEGGPSLPEGLEARVNPLGRSPGQTIAFPLGKFGPGQSVVKFGYILFAPSVEREEEWVQRLTTDNFGMLEAARTAWQKRLSAMAEVNTADPRVDQFLKAALYIVLAQRSRGGAFSPMHGYTYLWVRDSNGPVKLLSALGDTSDVGDHLEYHFRACAREARIGNNAALDLDLPQSVVQPDWGKVPVEPAEVPSFVILQHYWYYLSSGDLTLVKWHWPMLRRCLLGQAVSERGLLPFHGDETYRFPGYELFRAGETVTDWVCLETMSADSAFEYVAAAEAMAKLAAAVDKAEEAAEYRSLADRVRAATERTYWQADRGFYAPSVSDFGPQVHRYPFANIGLRPLWIGYGRPEDKRQADNVLAMLKYLARPDGLLKTTPGCGYYVGMLPGYTLYNLAELRHPATRKALAALLACAEPSGGYAEMIAPDGRSADRVWGLHRARPWETGINAEAVFHALTGYRPDAAARRAYLRPLLLGGQRLEVRRLPLGAIGLDLRVDEDHGVRHYRISLADNAPGRVTVDLSVVVWGSGLQARGDQGRPGQTLRGRPGPAWPWAQEVVFTDLALDADHPISVTATYRPWGDVERWPVAERFDYGPAPPPPSARAIVITGDAAQAKAVAEAKGGAWPLDTKIPWPAEYLRGTLLPGGRPAAPTVVLDVDRFSGSFKKPDFWTTGEGAAVLRDYEALGGRVERVVNPSPPPRSRQGFSGAARD